MRDGQQGNIFNIQRFSIHDGPGIRTVVFFKGCDLACQWCQNPESKNRDIEILYTGVNCIKCKRCEKVCPVDKILFSSEFSVRDVPCCLNCSSCSNVCPSGAIKVVGGYYRVAELCNTLIRDENFYKISKGGATFSGGEPLLQHEFLSEVLKYLKSVKIHTIIETAGFVPWKHFELVIDYVNCIYYDLKIFSEKEHIFYTGSSNKLILENLERLYSLSKSLKIRIPIIPEITGREENLKAIADYIYSHFRNSIEVELLPYNSLAEAKNKNIAIKGMPCVEIASKRKQHATELMGFLNMFTEKKIKARII